MSPSPGPPCLSPTPRHLPHSIQRVAVWILEKYYHDFPVYNPALLNLPKSVLAKKVSGFKVYSLGEGERPGSPALPVSPAVWLSVHPRELGSVPAPCSLRLLWPSPPPPFVLSFPLTPGD